MMTAQHHPHKRILVVEDSFPARELMSMILGGVGYMVSTAANGEEAIQRIRSFGKPDLILLDLRMPVMDGWTLSEKLKQDAELASIPVVVLSGLDEASEQTAMLEVARYLHKPVDTAELLKTVDKCCG